MNKISLIGSLFAVAVAFSGCSSSDDIESISVPTGTSMEQTSDWENTMLSLPVVSQSKWTATVSDDADWLYIVNPEGSGSGNVVVTTDTNFDDANRSAKVTITDETGSVVYTVKQALYSDAYNSAADTAYHNKGIGCGLFIKAQSGAKSIRDFKAGQIFNFSRMKESDVADLPNLVSEEDLSSAAYNLTQISKTDTASTSVKAELKVTVKYGLFKLNMSGSFNMFNNATENTLNYACTVSRPVKGLELDYATVADEYPYDPSQGQDYQKKRAHIFSASFLKLQNTIEQAVADGKDANDSIMKTALDKLDRIFGPVFVKYVQTGGSVDVDYQSTKTSGMDSLSIVGKLNSGFKGLFSLDVSASAKYLREANTSGEGSEINVKIDGGAVSQQDALVSSLATLCQEGWDISKITTAITDWSATVNNSNSSVLEYTVSGIWNLFTLDSQDVVREYFVNKYASQKDKCLYDLSGLN